MDKGRMLTEIPFGLALMFSSSKRYRVKTAGSPFWAFRSGQPAWVDKIFVRRESGARLAFCSFAWLSFFPRVQR